MGFEDGNLSEPDPDVSAAIEKALAEAAKSEGGDPPAPKTDLFGAPIPTNLFGQELDARRRRRKR
jgi:hypothetical protein